MPVQVHITDSMMVDGIAVYVSQKFENHNRQLLRIEGDMRSWKEITDPGIIEGPTFYLVGEEGQALTSALVRFYEGAPDMHLVRSDMLHERGRVDKMIEFIMQAERNKWVRPG
jgi:hypothetical protein